jgi:hypothetical protein
MRRSTRAQQGRTRRDARPRGAGRMVAAMVPSRTRRESGEDGRLLHDFFLAEVKAPSESTAPWDYYKIRRIIPAQEAAPPLAQSKCALVRL